MSGNDIVDLALAAKESTWQKKGFVEKIFTAKEQTYIREAAYPEKKVWTLWSMKESVYKIYLRQHGANRFFAPLKFNCTILDEGEGEVTINNIRYQVITTVAKKFIYTIARPEGYPEAPLLNYWFTYKEQAGINETVIHTKLIDRYAALTGRPAKSLSIVKDKNSIPCLYYREKQLYIPVSISHHGRYGAFTIN